MTEAQCKAAAASIRAQAQRAGVRNVAALDGCLERDNIDAFARAVSRKGVLQAMWDSGFDPAYDVAEERAGRGFESTSDLSSRAEADASTERPALDVDEAAAARIIARLHGQDDDQSPEAAYARRIVEAHQAARGEKPKASKP